ncbi:uncharacterized protein LOC142519718 [Primulina tabacum]|uniref:uncharacterized protein LOC142519718 n=1 Tax=Primulina tabacum TaxID=48773 RepID=UPI003F59AC58
MEQAQQAPRPQQDIYEQFRRLNPKEFSGTKDLFMAKGWIRFLELHFRYLDMRDADRVRCATYMLRDDASLLREGAAHGVNLATLMWDQFKDLFYGNYSSAYVRGRLTTEFISLRQGDSTVAVFIRKFDRGCHFVPIIVRDAAENMRRIGFERYRCRDAEEKAPGSSEFTTPQKAWGTFKCFICKEECHKAADCPRIKRATTGRAYFIHAKEVEAEPDTTLITGLNGFDGISDAGKIFIAGVATYALRDSGATYLFISETFVRRLEIIPEDMDLDLEFRFHPLVKDYDCDISYHPGKANVVADALRRKNVVIAQLSVQRPLQAEIQRFELSVFARGDALNLYTLTVHLTLRDRIRAGQPFDEQLHKWRLRDESKGLRLYSVEDDIVQYHD